MEAVEAKTNEIEKELQEKVKPPKKSKTKK